MNQYKNKHDRFGKRAVFIAFFIFVAVISFLFGLKQGRENLPLQPVKILVADLGQTLGALEKISLGGSKLSLPYGLKDKVAAEGKADVIIGTILLSHYNLTFDKKGIARYRAKHPQDIIWLEGTGEPSDERVWIFLQRGTSPDPDFFEIETE